MATRKRLVSNDRSRQPAWPHQYKLGLIVGSQDPDEFVGIVNPAVWKESDISSIFSAISADDRDEKAVTIAQQIGRALNLKVEDAFFVREIHDNHDQRRAVVCLVVATTKPIEKKITRLPAAKKVINRSDAYKSQLIDALIRTLSGYSST